jgi:hypothetical protein
MSTSALSDQTKFSSCNDLFSNTDTGARLDRVTGDDSSSMQYTGPGDTLRNRVGEQPATRAFLAKASLQQRTRQLDMRAGLVEWLRFWM